LKFAFRLLKHAYLPDLFQQQDTPSPLMHAYLLGLF
jgi:hypothetical protein